MLDPPKSHQSQRSPEGRHEAVMLTSNTCLTTTGPRKAELKAWSQLELVCWVSIMQQTTSALDLPSRLTGTIQPKQSVGGLLQKWWCHNSPRSDRKRISPKLYFIACELFFLKSVVLKMAKKKGNILFASDKYLILDYYSQINLFFLIYHCFL